MRTAVRTLAAASVIAIAADMSWAAAKKKKEEITQTLEVLPDPPSTLKVDTARMTFEVSPLTNKGLLSQQARDAIKTLWRINKGGQIVKLRAFVAGTGDMRRVQQLVSEMFSEKKMPLPVVTTVQVGGLPVEGAQVIIESVSLAKKPVNPHGLAFVSGQAATAPLDPSQAKMPVAGLAEQSLANLTRALASAGLSAADTLRVTCFSSSLDDYAAVGAKVAAAFPGSVNNIVQVQRAPANQVVECEAVARLKEPAGGPVKMLNPDGLEQSKNYSHVALVSAPRVILTSTQMGFRAQDSDVRLAFSRVKGQLEQNGGSIRNVVMSSIYPLSNAIINKIRAIRFEFYDAARPPASTMLPFEGLPSVDATFALDVIAIPN